jgi:hypothetical protein
MMIEDRFFDQAWVQELSNEEFRMLIYLLHFASKKTGIVELNMRMLNFASNTGKIFTKDDVLKSFNGMLRLIPNRENTAIFPDYISTNWAKGGKPIDVVRNPLFRSVVQELASHGLTIGDVNAMSKKQIQVKGEEHEPITDTAVTVVPKRRLNYNELFDKFWSEYPSSCPRKVDKKKCLDKFLRILKDAKDANTTFDAVMSGLKVWRMSELWNADGGKYIKAPLVWLNGACWLDNPKKGNGNGSSSSTSANATSHKEEAFNNLW